MSKKDISNKDYYYKNYQNFLAKIDKTDKQIRAILKDVKNRKFMVFHPSWGYFAKEYNLTQLAIEANGKKPKPRELIVLIKEAKKERVSAILTQKEFSDKSAKIIANELNIPVIKVSPLSIEWSKNLIKIAKTIAND